MKFILSRTSDYKSREEREFNTLEEVMALALEHKEPVILTPPGTASVSSDKKDWELEIYDDYRE